MRKKVDAEVMAKDNFFTRAMAIRYNITKEDDDKTIEDKIAGRWVDPNKSVVQGSDDENDFIEF